MADQPAPETPPAADPAAGGAPPAPTSAEEAQVDALNPVGGEAPPAVAGEDVQSAEEVLGEAPVPPAAEQDHKADEDQRDYRDLYLRASADLDNFRKRSRRDVEGARHRGIGQLAKELLPAIDNLERALQAAAAAGDASQDLVQGLRLVQAELTGAFTRAGVIIEDPKGQPFDPHRHEALAQQPVEGTPAGVVVEVYQPGYVLGETVLRAARVVVSG